MKGKGMAEVYTILGIVVVALFAIIFIIFMVPSMLEDAMSFLSANSAEAVSRNLAGLVTVSAAAPNEISIDYLTKNNMMYDLSIDNRMVDVKLLTEVMGMKGEVSIGAGLDAKCNQQAEPCSIGSVSTFQIEKSIAAGSTYSCTINGEELE